MSDSVKLTVGSIVGPGTGSADGSLTERKGMTLSVAILLRKGPRTWHDVSRQPLWFLLRT